MLVDSSSQRHAAELQRGCFIVVAYFAVLIAVLVYIIFV